MNSLCDSVGSTSGFWVLVALAVNSREVGKSEMWLTVPTWDKRVKMPLTGRCEFFQLRPVGEVV